MRRELEPNCAPQLFMGSYVFLQSLVSVPEAFAKVNSTQFPWRIAQKLSAFYITSLAELQKFSQFKVLSEFLAAKC